LVVLGNTVPSGHTAGRVFDINGISPTVMEKHSKVVQIAVDKCKNNNSQEVELPAALKYQRTEYAKKIRKDYEAGRIKERRCNMREYTLRDDGLCNTITTVTKDNYIAVGAAMRGRYDDDGSIQQHLEVRNDEVSNSLTTVNKDTLIVEYKRMRTDGSDKK
jgi:hypothetical protein